MNAASAAQALYADKDNAFIRNRELKIGHLVHDSDFLKRFAGPVSLRRHMRYWRMKLEFLVALVLDKATSAHR